MRGDLTGLLYDVPASSGEPFSPAPDRAAGADLGIGVLVDQAGRPRLLPGEVTLARLALGAAVLFAIVLARREAIPRSARLWAHIAVAALFANAVPYLLFAVAEQRVDSSTAGIINATTPLWTMVLALAVRHQQSVTGWQAAGLVVGFAGAVLIFTPWRTAGGLFSAGGLECLAASVSYAVSYIYMDRFLARRGIGPVVLSACQLAAAAVMLAVALAVSGAPDAACPPPGTSRRSRCWGSSGPGSRTC